MTTLLKEIKLIMTEVGTNNNKWWTGQLFDDGMVKATWGRVGYSGDSGEWSGGQSYLDKKVREKLKKGYTELKTVGTASLNGGGAVVKNHDLHSIARSQILKASNPTLERLITRFVQANVHKITTNTNITYNSTTGLFATPMGIVTMEGLTEARDLLAEIAPLVRNRNFGAQADALLSKYLRLIPQHLGMGRFSAQTVIPDNNALQKQMDLIDSLESSYQALQTAHPLTTATATPGKPQEQVFKVDLDVLVDFTERARLDNYFERSKKRMHGYDHVHVKEIFAVNIHDMTRAFETQRAPLKEVFHGTSQANCLSILKSGLKVSPPSTAAIAGKMFGNGIYGAINSTKSLGYTYGRWGQGGVGDSGWLFICDFAMGRTYETRDSLYSGAPQGYDSVWAKAGSSLSNDELIVYRKPQVKIKYLLECK
jgi:poly [ADP-ribose] polymerase